MWLSNVTMLPRVEFIVEPLLALMGLPLEKLLE